MTHGAGIFCKIDSIIWSISPPCRYGASADVFSFALVLLELLAGKSTEARFAEAGLDARSAANFHAQGKRLSLMGAETFGLNSSLAQPCIELIQQCWVDDKNCRPTMSTILAALESDEKSRGGYI